MYEIYLRDLPLAGCDGKEIGMKLLNSGGDKFPFPCDKYNSPARTRLLIRTMNSPGSYEMSVNN